eukprot:scaffold159168_cov35-Tisochrysis_lutea.AAC.4
MPILADVDAPPSQSCRAAHTGGSKSQYPPTQSTHQVGQAQCCPPNGTEGGGRGLVSRIPHRNHRRRAGHPRSRRCPSVHPCEVSGFVQWMWHERRRCRRTLANPELLEHRWLRRAAAPTHLGGCVRRYSQPTAM